MKQLLEGYLSIAGILGRILADIQNSTSEDSAIRQLAFVRLMPSIHQLGKDLMDQLEEDLVDPKVISRIDQKTANHYGPVAAIIAKELLDAHLLHIKQTPNPKWN